MDDDDKLMAALFDGVDETNVEDRIKEMVFTDKKIVTSKILGRKLKTQFDVARQHLEKFYETHRVGQKRNVYAIYYLSGVVDKKGVEVYKAGLVREANLEASKESLTRVESCHIFSLQCSDIKDVTSALLADSMEDDGKEISNGTVISCVNGHRRESSDLSQDEPTSPDPPTNSSTSKYFQPSPIKEKPKESMATKPKESIKEKSISTKSKDNPKEVQSKKQPSPAKSKEPPKETTSKKPVETEKTKLNDKKRPATNSKDSTASKKQATLMTFFKKS